jgi:hypothetical protein
MTVTAQSHVISVACPEGSGRNFLNLVVTSAAVMIVSWKRFEGAVAALRRLQEAGLPLVLATSTISGTRAPVLRAIWQG